MSNQNQQKIPEGWKEMKLGDIGKVSMCRRVFKKETFLSGPIPFYKISTFGGKADAFISKDIFENYKNKYPYPKKGDILISASGTIGRTVVFNGEKAYFQDSNIVWISNPEDKVLNIFLKYVYKKTKWVSTDGGVISRLYNSNLRSINLLLPPLSEQNRIVEVLETWDKYLEKLDQKIKVKKNIKKGLMQNLLTGKMRLGEFKKEWKKTTVKNIFEIKKGIGLSKEKLIEDGQNECILYGELYTKYNEIINKVIGKTNFYEGLKSKKGDILIPGSTTTCAFDLAIASAILKDNVFLGGDINVLRPKKLNISSEFYGYYLTHAQKKSLVRIGQGITIVHLYGKDIGKIIIDLPEEHEQNAIADILITADKEIETLEKQRQIIKNQKKYLLNNLITGQIRLPEFVNKN